MKRRMLFFLILLSLPLVGMKRRHANDELADFPKAQRASERPRPQKELSDDVKAQIAWLQGLAERGEFSNEVAASILKSLATIKMYGGTEEQKLYQAINSIRAFMEAFPQFYGDVPINRYLIEELAKRYASGNAVKVAIALATTGAGKWLQDYLMHSPNKIIDTGLEFLHAAQHGQLGTIRFILNYFPAITNIMDRSKSTALMLAAENGYITIVDRLLQMPGINVNLQNSNGNTALMRAAENGHTVVVERLLQMPNINVNTQGHQRMTALIYAAQNGHAAVVERLLQVPEINVNIANQQGATALMYAATKGYAPIVERLLQMPNINVNATDPEGNTALVFAVGKGHLAVVDRLLQVPGVDVNAQNQKGGTALMAAVVKGQVAIVDRLLQMPNINVNLRAPDGMTVLRLVRRQATPNKEAIIKLLVDHGATE